MSTIESETIEWTRRTSELWTGRRSDSPAGTIERGARFTYVDLDGQPHRGYRSLADAQRAAAGPVTRSTCGPDAGRRRVYPVLFVATTAAVVTDLLLLGSAWFLSL
jgi:hypothetical protein